MGKSLTFPDSKLLEKWAGWGKARVEAHAGECEDRRQAALAEARRLVGLLTSKFLVHRIYLFGSILRPDRFGMQSDIDLAVEGLPSLNFFSAFGEIMMESAFPVDLKPFEEVNDLLKERILEGVVIYERPETG